MTTKEVSIITGLSISYINKVRTGKHENLKPETVNRVNFLLDLDVSYFEALFAKVEFAIVCQAVIEKGTERHSKQIVNIIRFANKCLRRHRTILDELAERPFDPDNIDYRDLMGIYMADVKTMIQNTMFSEMCILAMKLCKAQNVRVFIDLLLDIYDMLNDLDKQLKP